MKDKNKIKNKIRGKRRVLVSATLLFIMVSSVTVFAGEKWGNYYGCKAKGYVHTMIVESGWGKHAGNVGIYLSGDEWELLGYYNYGVQFGGDVENGQVCGYRGEDYRKVQRRKTDKFTYVNAWLQTDDGYIDAPEGY